MKIQFLSVEVPKTAVPILDMLIRLILAFGSFAIPFRQVANHLEGSLRLPPSQLLPSEPSPSFCPPALRGNAPKMFVRFAPNIRVVRYTSPEHF